MKKLSSKIVFPFVFTLLVSILLSCDKSDDNPVGSNSNNKLLVEFTNRSESAATITSIITQPMGKASESTTPTGAWGSNILSLGKKLAPGEKTTFTLEIPNLHWVRYRLAIDDGNGGELWLHEQPNYGDGNLPISHWGSDDRTVYVLISYDTNSAEYYIQGWGDNAGIDGQ